MDSLALTKMNNQKQLSEQRIKEIADKIDQLLQNKIHLLNPGLWGTWSLVRQDFEVPVLFELNFTSSFLAVNDLTINVQERFSKIISKYEKVVVKFGYVKPPEDPYYEKYSKTREKMSRKTQRWLAGRILEMHQQQDANNNSATKPSTSSNETKAEDEKKESSS